MKYTPISISPNEAQFLETRKFQLNEIARIFRVPPHMVGDLEKSSFSNIEQQSLEFVKYTLDPWVLRWEQAINKRLLTDEEKKKYYVKFNVDGLLRGDYQSRMNGYAVGRQNGWLSANDIRRLENLDIISKEGGALTFGDATFNQVLLDAHKLHVAIKVTEELLYDSAFNLENYILEEFSKALSNAEEDAFLNGNGTGRPTGIFDKTKGGTYLKEVASLKEDNILDLVYKLARPYRKNASFIMNDKIIAKIRQFKDNNGAYIWQPSYTDGEPDRILGYPVYTSAFAPENAIAFGDFSYYNIGDRGTRSFQELRELFAGNGMIAFLAKERVDGKLILKEAVQILPFKNIQVS